MKRYPCCESSINPSPHTKKRESIGNSRNPGREGRPEGSLLRVRTHDFRDKEWGFGIPYGVFDLTHNDGWVGVGIDHIAAEFATESVRRWRERMGSLAYPAAEKPLMTADCGGSSGSRVRLWKVMLQRRLELHSLTKLLYITLNNSLFVSA